MAKEKKKRANTYEKKLIIEGTLDDVLKASTKPKEDKEDKEDKKK